VRASLGIPLLPGAPEPEVKTKTTGKKTD